MIYKYLISLFLILMCLLNGSTAEESSKKKRAFVETGFHYGTNTGDYSRHFSDLLMIFEVGYLRGARSGESNRGWGYGGTLFGSAGENDYRLGIKPRLRYRFHPKWATDVSSGLIFATISNDPGLIDKGFVGGISLHYSTWLTMKSDIMVRPIEPYRTYDPNDRTKFIYHPSATEVSVYGGIAFRGMTGWITTGVGLAAIITITVLFVLAWASALGSLN